MQKGEIKQYIIPDDIINNNYQISFNQLPPYLGYQIGISIEEKAFMEIANPGDLQNNILPENVKMIMFFTDQQNPINNIIEIGRTYIYEPGDTINLNSISFDSTQWDKTDKKGYLEVIVTNYNKNTEDNYFNQKEEEE